MKRLTIIRRNGTQPVLRIDVDREDDGRWIVDAIDLPGVMCYGKTYREALDNTALLALRVLDERIQNGDEIPDLDPDQETTDQLHLHHHA
jgi:predicted RNase H-like HicB family nuclease